MREFIKDAHFIKLFYSEEDFCILNIGYDDFIKVQPLTEFRVQNFYTWHFVLRGSGTLEINGKKYEIKSGEMFLIPPDTKMRYFPNREDPWEYVWFAFKGNIVEQYSSLAGFSLKSPVCECRHFHKIKNVLSRMFRSFTEEGGGYFSALSSFYEVMEICTAYLPRTGIQGVKEIIDESFTLPGFSIEKLCYDVGISHAHLLRLFKNEYGITVIKYVIKKRIELACELLQTTELSVGSVAISCGFSDEIHFMKTFKKEMGVSALNYKKKHRIQ